MFELYTVNEIKKTISKRVKQERIKQNKTQKEFSVKSGIKLSTYKKFEKEGEGSFENFLLILISLGKIGDIEDLLAEKKLFSSKNAVLAKASKKEGLIRQRVKHSKGSSKMIASSTSSKSNIANSSIFSNNILNNIQRKKKLEEKNG